MQPDLSQDEYGQNHHSHRLAVVLIISSSIMMSFGGLIVRSIEHADPWQINLYRSLAMASAIVTIMMFRYRGQIVSTACGIGKTGFAGGVMLAIAGVGYLQSITHTTVANTLFILSAIPFFTAALARIFIKERLKRATLITMCVASVGILIMLGEGLGLGSWYGNLMALVTALSFATYAVIVRRKQGIDMLPAVLVSAILIAIVSIIVRIDALAISLNDLLLCFLWGGVLAGLSNWMFVTAMRHLAAAEITLLMLLEFALGPIWVWWFVNEVPSTWTLVGGSLVLASVAVRALATLSGASGPASVSTQ